jgi:predicted RNA polymerase sigma factor
MAAGKRRAVDRFRRDRMMARKHAEIGLEIVEAEDTVQGIKAAPDDDLDDELLGLMFAACHPVLSPDAQAALTVRLIGGLMTDEIARAKKARAKVGLRFEVPGLGADRRAF